MPRAEHVRTIAASVAALTVVGVAIVAIAVAGRVAPPELEALVDAPDPDIEGALVLLTDDDPCLAVLAAAGGQPRTLHCAEELSEVGWVDDDTVWASGWLDGDVTQVVEVDLDDDETVEVRLDEQPNSRRHESGRPRPGPTERGDGVRAVLRDDPPGIAVYDSAGELEEEIHLEGGRGYRLTGIGWSPDERWLLVSDSADRLLVVESTLIAPRVLAEGVQAAVWRETDVLEGG